MISDDGAFDHAKSSCLANEAMTGSVSSDVFDEEAESSYPSQRSEQRPSHRRPQLLGATVASLVIFAVACYVNTLSSTKLLSKTTRGHEKIALNRYLEDGVNDDGVDGNDDEGDGGGEGDDNQQRHQDDDTPIYVDDDFVDDYYAFQQDPGPRRLLPITATDVFGFLLASMGVTLAAGGGIGGGGMVVPIYILVMQLPPREAIPLAVVTVVGGALGTTLVNSRRRHPIADRPLIDWGLMIVMEPLILVGTLFGTLLHRVVSEKVIVVMLVVFYIVMARTMLIKARRMHESEAKYLDELRTARTFEEQVKRETIALEPAFGSTDEFSSVITPLPLKAAREKIKFLLENEEEFSSLRSDLLEQEKVTPREKILALCGMFTVLIFLNIMVGGGAFESPWGIQCGGIAFFVVHVIMASCLIAFAWAAHTYLVNRHEIKQIVDFDFVHGDIHWDSRSKLLYPLLFASAGVFAGMFGVGGGMVTVPLLLAMGVHPTVATATSSCMTLFTTISTTTEFSIYGLVMWDYAAVCFVIGFCAALFGQKIMAYARDPEGRNFQRNSLIAYSIGGVILISAFLMTVLYVLIMFEIVVPDDSEDGGICVGYSRVAT